MLRFRPLWKFTASMLPLFLGCVALGAWQLERLQWKLALVAQADRNLNAPPIPVSRALSMDAQAAQYRRVVASGHFDHSKETYVFGTGPNGAAIFHVIAPLILNNGRALLIDRGIVPERLRDPSSRSAGQVQGVRHLIGVWRIPDARGWFTPIPDYAKRIWYARDVPGIAEADGIKLAAPVIIEADSTPNPGGWPKGGQTVVVFRNDHLQYAITWFALAAVILGGWIAFHISRKRFDWH